MFSTDTNSTDENTIAAVFHRPDDNRTLLSLPLILIIYSYYADSETQLDASTRRNTTLRIITHEVESLFIRSWNGMQSSIANGASMTTTYSCVYGIPLFIIKKNLFLFACSSYHQTIVHILNIVIGVVCS